MSGSQVSDPSDETIHRPVVIVPCYNEADRLDQEELRRLASRADVWLVDDGSTDATPQRIAAIADDSSGRLRALHNGSNQGKAETIRRWMLEALGQDAPVVGFLDADLATPVEEMIALLDLLESGPAEAVTGARVALSGRDIRRSQSRHYSGRVFSTIASLALGVPYYDTQCGAKAFRSSATLREALAEPFFSRWAFDVELLGRLLAGSPTAQGLPPDSLVEYPLRRWHDIPGSKLSLRDACVALGQLAFIWRDLSQRRRRGRRP